MQKLLLLGLVFSGLSGLASSANASSLGSDRARLDGSVGHALSRATVVDTSNRTATEPRDPYTEGA